MNPSMIESLDLHFEKRKNLILDLGLRPEALNLLKKYLEFLCAANEELNLISRKMTAEELIDNHVIDSLLPLKFYPQNLKNAADFGSGGGLPGVIYALHFSKTQFHLYEKSKLKQEFLLSCQALAPNLSVPGEIPLELKNIQLVSARAFKPIDVILNVSRKYYENQGKYFLFKGRQEKIDEELSLAQKKFKNIKVDIIPLRSPLRCDVVIFDS